MKKLNKFIYALGAASFLPVLPLIAAKCTTSNDDSKVNKDDQSNKKDNDDNSNKNNNTTNNTIDGKDDNSSSNTPNTNEEPNKNEEPKEEDEASPSKPNEIDNNINNDAPSTPSNPTSPKVDEEEDNKPIDPEKLSSKEKLILVYSAFNKYSNIEANLNNKEATNKLSEDLDPAYQAFHYTNQNDRDFFLKYELDHIFLGEFGDLFELFSSILTDTNNAKDNKKKAIDLFNQIKAKITKAYNKLIKENNN
ncbi:Hypothetical protein, predicted lipoprotein [Metamycoplasma auris 15026]|uniref:Variable surface lipoprotein n=1 Tax=Metamycoplasma auris 15026 TaxID=1188233 RepID=N9VD05_9BACT|nr:variable surface lipoprotein [Metamycoplasma auris]ENY69286.1 Hypothetical protein, predicted lipoprotein [Metamycoplasma auris 15026]